MTLLSNWVTVGVLAGMVAVGPVHGFPPEEMPADYSPAIEFCPPGLDAFPAGNVIELLEAALACSELELMEDAIAFYLAAMAREDADRLFTVVPEAADEVAAFRSLSWALMTGFEAQFLGAYEESAGIALRAYPVVFDWPLMLDGYDPGYPVVGMPDADIYRQAFRLAVASDFARGVLGVHAMQDPKYAELYRELHELGESLDYEVSHSVAAELVARQRELNSEFLESFKPSLIEARFKQYGIFESFGSIEHVPAPDTADGTHIVPERNVFHEQSLVIPAELGLGFGFDYELAGVVPGTEDRLLMRAIHPPMRNAAGEWQTVSTANFNIESWGGSANEHLSYRFSEPHQMLPGEWTLQVIYYDEVVLSKTFQVVESDDSSR